MIHDMNHDIPPFDDAAREREWLAQENAMRRERLHLDPHGDDARTKRYRMLARVLRQPLDENLPPDFARQLAAQVGAARPTSRGAGFELGLTAVPGLAGQFDRGEHEVWRRLAASVDRAVAFDIVVVASAAGTGRMHGIHRADGTHPASRKKTLKAALRRHPDRVPSAFAAPDPEHPCTSNFRNCRWRTSRISPSITS
jgi:hypothetical protein